MSIADTAVFENAEWTVTACGLEHKGTGYFIAREHLGMRRSDGLWNWPVHVLEKSWCAPEAFTEAFLRAVRAYRVAPDSRLTASFRAGTDGRRSRGEEAGFRSVGDCLPETASMGEKRRAA